MCPQPFRSQHFCWGEGLIFHHWMGMWVFHVHDDTMEYPWGLYYDEYEDIILPRNWEVALRRDAR